jgi:hypothetical protein
MLPEGWVWYFAYGSNMNPARLFEQRLGGAGVGHGPRIGGRLMDWALCFNVIASSTPGGGYANITRQAGASTPGTLNAIPPEGLGVLDHYEGVASGHYQREAVMVVTTSGPVPATTYIACHHLAEGLRPTEDYRAHLLAGADLLPAAHLDWLRALPCLSPG